MKAHILMSTDVGMMWGAAEEALKVQGVKMSNAVTGPYDVIAYVEFDDMDILGRIIDAIQSIKGVRRTQTAIVMTPRIIE